MREIRAIIADDEPLARRGIRQLLEAHPDITVAGECRDGRETLRALHELAPDLVFLDVQMPEVDGFGVVHAFEAHALDYLVKPVNEARFSAALARVREHMRSADAVALARKLNALLAV